MLCHAAILRYLTGIADQLGFADEFTESRDEMEWVSFLYGQTRANAAEIGISIPEFDDFWAGQQMTVEAQLADVQFPLEQFRDDPQAHPLETPSGKN